MMKKYCQAPRCSSHRDMRELCIIIMAKGTVQTFYPPRSETSHDPAPRTTPPPSPDRRRNQGRDVVPSRGGAADPKAAEGSLDGFRLGPTIPRRVRGEATHHHRNRLRRLP